MNLLRYSFLAFFLVLKCHATELPETESYPNPSEHNIDVITTDNKSVSELMNEQTEAIRKIISAVHNSEYDSEVSKTEEDKAGQTPQEESLEQLKEKCAHHFKISSNKHNDKFEELSEGSDVVKVAVPLAQSINPQFVPNIETTAPFLFSLYADNQVFPNKKPEEKPVVTTTQQSQDKQFLQTQTHSFTDQQNLYLTKLAPPVIPQQPLSFHKDTNKPGYITKIAPMTIPQGYQNYLQHTTNENVQASSTTTTKFKTTEQTNPEDAVKAQNFDYVQLEPVWLQKTVLSDGRIFYYWFRKVSQAPAGQTHSEIEKTQSGNLLQPQLKFVLPILPASSEVVSDGHWYFEPQGHYSKIVKSNFRSPTLHMIRALKVPHPNEKGKEEVPAKIDDVSVE